MKRARFLVILALAVSGPACHAKGKGLGPLKVPHFVQADNGLGVTAAIRGGDFVERVILHFMGMDPPLVWVAPPKTAEVIPAWMDEPVVMPATYLAIGAPACGATDYGQLAATLREAPSAPTAAARPGGLIRMEAPAVSAAPQPAADLDSREIYGHFSDGCPVTSG